MTTFLDNLTLEQLITLSERYNLEKSNRKSALIIQLKKYITNHKEDTNHIEKGALYISSSLCILLCIVELCIMIYIIQVIVSYIHNNISYIVE